MFGNRPYKMCLLLSVVEVGIISNTCAVVAELRVARLKYNTFIPCLVPQH
jgi:hypothetical protein